MLETFSELPLQLIPSRRKCGKVGQLTEQRAEQMGSRS